MFKPLSESFSRRDFLNTLGLTTAGLLIEGCARGKKPAPASNGDASKEDLSSRPLEGAGFYSFKLGERTVSVVSDGTFLFNPPHPTFGTNRKKKEVEKAFQQSFIPADHVVGHVNLLLIEDSSGKTLVDTGCGSLFGPTMGRAVQYLRNAGVKPEEIKTVVLTHMHPDHIGGILDTAGQVVFPNANFFVTAKERAFWGGDHPDLSKVAVSDDFKKNMTGSSAKVLAAIAPRITEVTASGEIVPGIEGIFAAGHTPGHMALGISSGKDQLFYIADVAHHSVISFEHPDWYVAFDTDPTLAAKTRRKLLDRAVADRAFVAGPHLPFPGVGHVRRRGNAFEWVPAIWDWQA